MGSDTLRKTYTYRGKTKMSSGPDTHAHARASAHTHTHTHTPRVTEYFFFFNIYLAVLGLSCGRTFDLCCGMWEFVVVVVLACGL